MSAPIIRPATRADAADIVCFFDMASGGLAAYVWETLRQPGQAQLEVGRGRVLQEDGSASYRNAHIAEVDGAVAGGLVGYLLDDPIDPKAVAETPETFRALMELEEQVSGHWYVNALAVYPEFRGQGVAARLLAHADDLGRATNAKGMAIIVASTNAPAIGLYTKLGYKPVARRPQYPFPGSEPGAEWRLLTKAHS